MVAADSSRRWPLLVWLIVLCILGLALYLRLSIYDRFLPFVDYGDEAVYVALAHDARGLSDQTALRETYGLLAPLYVTLSIIGQELTNLVKGHPWDIPAEYFYTMRLMAVAIGVITTAVVLWIGHQLARLPGAVLAGVVWAASPSIVEYNTLAIPDPPLYAACALAVASALAAVRWRSFWMLLLSLLFGIAALYLKLWIGSAIVPFAVASLMLIRQDARRWGARVGLLTLVGCAVALHFFLVLNPFANDQITDNVSGGSVFANGANASRLFNNLSVSLYPIDFGTGLALAVLIAGAAAYFYARRAGARTLEAQPLVILLGYLLTTWVLSAAVSNASVGIRFRHVFPMTVIIAPLWAAALMQIVWAVQHASTAPAVKRWLPTGVAVGVLAAFVPGFISGNATTIANFRVQDPVTEAMRWFDGSPPRDGTVLTAFTSPYELLWNRFWGAYPGDKPFDWISQPFDDSIVQPIASLHARGFRWVVLDDKTLASVEGSAGAQAWMDSLYRVKTFDIPTYFHNRFGEHGYVYRLDAPQVQADDRFGDTFHLVGYDLSADRAAPGSTVTLRPYWQIDRQPLVNVSMFMHLYDAADSRSAAPDILWQWDGEPLPGAERPSPTWADTDEIYFGEQVTVSLPTTLPAGSYVIAIGLYDYVTGARLPLPDGATFARIALTLSP